MPQSSDSSSTEKCRSNVISEAVMLFSRRSPSSSQGRDLLRHLAEHGQACWSCDLLRIERHDDGSPCRRCEATSWQGCPSFSGGHWDPAWRGIAKPVGGVGN